MLNCKLIYSLIGEKIKLLRNGYLLEPNEMGEILGISEQDYLKFEEGYPIPTVILKSIIDWYSISIHHILPTSEECRIIWVFSDCEAIQGKVRFIKTKKGVSCSIDGEGSTHLRSYK